MQSIRSLSEALASIEASAAFLTESAVGRDEYGADALREELARIRDIAREALGLRC